MKTTGGGRFDGSTPLVFNATFTYLRDALQSHNYLYSFYEIDSPKDFEYLGYSIEAGDKILIDSGTHSIYMALL